MPIEFLEKIRLEDWQPNMFVDRCVPSDAYLMTAYDKKSVELTAAGETSITIEVDVDGTGLWVPYKTFEVTAGKTVIHTFPAGFSAYWVRAISDSYTIATVWLKYE